MMEKSNMRLHKDMHSEKNENLQWMNMSHSQHAMELEYEKGHQGSFSKSEAITKDSGKRMKNEGSKCSALCMCLPGFGFGVAHGKGIIIQENSHEDESFSSYFDLPSIILKCSGDDA
ncbi:hypothetical protein ACSQ67_020258 [Phaseolus vulgaris]